MTEPAASREQFNPALCDFLTRSSTPFHAVAAMRERLDAAGFVRLEEAQSWQLAAGGRYYLTRNDSSLVAFVLGSQGEAADGMRMVGAHTDSPCLMVKPQPELVRQGCFQLGVQVYGGALLNPWFDRDLSLAGRVSYRDGRGRLCSALLDFGRAIATIPSLAIHLDREANQNRTVNAQTDIVPLLSLASEKEVPDFRELLAEQLRHQHPGIDLEQVLDFELSFYDTQPAAPVGMHNEFIASARLDNLLSCFTGLEALLQAGGEQSCLLICNDHEEVGSLSTSGAQGPLLRSVLRRLAGDEERYVRLTASSLMISADNAHGIHPNYADRHDANHGPRINGGPVIKINANQRYATNSETASLYRMLAQEEGVPVQSFVVRSDMGCGSTIGPITAGGTGIPTLDIGVPTFAMHSIRELAGSEDAWGLCRVLRRFYDFAGPLGT